MLHDSLLNWNQETLSGRSRASQSYQIIFIIRTLDYSKSEEESENIVSLIFKSQRN